MRLDNGAPWGNAGDLPTPLALWLHGAGCGVINNPPGCPQHNAKVERCHGLFDTWGEPEQCLDCSEWQAKVQWLVQLQRDRYPAINGLSRLAAFPALTVISRPYTGGWNLQCVDELLATGHWRRVVGKKGQITLYRRSYTVGQQFRRQTVYVRFDATERTWLVSDREGKELKRLPAPEITAARIQSLDLSYVKPNERRPGRCQNPTAFVVT